MIKLSLLNFSYPGQDKPALQDISFHLYEGDFALLIGPSGAGKSTLLRCINGLVPHFSGGNMQGDIVVNGLNPVLATPKVLSRHVGFVFQDPEAQFVMDRVEDEIAFSLENAAMPPQEMRVRVEEALDLLDLAPLRSRPLDTLSGGERQRVAIASALAFRPKVLVLDEPTSQLDPKSAEDVLHTLVRLNADLGLTIVIAEHRMERVLPFVDTLIYLSAEGEGVLTGEPAQILGEIDLTPPLVTLGKALHWHPLPLTIKEGRRFSRQMQISGAQNNSHSDSAVNNNRPILEAINLQVSFEAQEILRGVDLALKPGEIVALMGRNGAGKSTILKTVVGLIKQKKGSVLLNGADTKPLDVAQICQEVAYLPQNPNALLFAETVQEELLITLRNHGLENGNAAERVEPLLNTLGLSHKMMAYPRDLSVGERQRVALGAVIVTKPKALLLDEPTRGLDYKTKQGLIDLLKGWAQQGMAILLVTHDVELAAAVARRVILLSQGEIIASGPPVEVLASSPLFAPQVARLFPDTGWLTVDDALSNLST